jgi:hypothetical protein
MFVVGGIGTVSSWFLMKPFGRRDLYIYGQAILVCIMLVTGILGAADRESTGAKYAIGGLLILFTFVYDITIGPVCYSLVAEIGSTRLRSKVSRTFIHASDTDFRLSFWPETCTTSEVSSSVSSTLTCSTPLLGTWDPSPDLYGLLPDSVDSSG